MILNPNGNAVNSVEFLNQAACENAAKSVHSSTDWNIITTCVPKRL